MNVNVPENPDLLHHDSDCPHASRSWLATTGEIKPGKHLTVLGREYVVLSLNSGALPQAIADTINEKRLQPDSLMSEIFPYPVTVEQIRNIDNYERQKRQAKGGAGPSYLLDTNAGVKAWCERHHMNQECYAAVRGLLAEIFQAEEETQYNALVAKLKGDPMAKELFVIDTCKEKELVLGVVFCNALICLNLLQAIRKLGPNGINISVDGTFQLAKGGWALITTGTHSIDVHRANNILSHKARPFVYVFAFSESKDVFVKADMSVKKLASVLFGTRIESFAAVAMDHCEAARLAFSELNPTAKILLD
jgi:hypothetical protein